MITSNKMTHSNEIRFGWGIFWVSIFGGGSWVFFWGGGFVIAFAELFAKMSRLLMHPCNFRKIL